MKVDGEWIGIVEVELVLWSNVIGLGKYGECGWFFYVYVS